MLPSICQAGVACYRILRSAARHLSSAGIQSDGEEEQEEEDTPFHRRLMNLVEKVVNLRKKKEDQQDEQPPEEEPKPSRYPQVVEGKRMMRPTPKSVLGEPMAFQAL